MINKYKLLLCRNYSAIEGKACLLFPYLCNITSNNETYSHIKKCPSMCKNTHEKQIPTLFLQ